MSRFSTSIRSLTLAMLLTATASAQLLPVLGAQRSGTATAQFLKIPVGARAAAMGESFIAVANDASALYWNPAGITQFDRHEVIVAHTEWLVDVRHQFFGAVYHLSAEDAIGLALTSVHTDDMPVTTEFQPAGTGSYFRFSDLAVGVTYARKLTPQFSAGATVRYIEETLDVLSMRGVMVDLGTYYWMGLGTARFSAVISHFGNQIRPTGRIESLTGDSESDFQEFSPPTMFRFGFAFEPINEAEHMLTTSIQLNHPNDNSENISLGAEYLWMKTFALRVGYRLNVEEQGLTFGGGVATDLDIVGLTFDYGYAAFGRLGAVHRVTLGARL
ncbi:MAG: PorV/PorQ family protein [Bacteroidetes bacterium]|jgi:long-subunit fatty acid transport protein|nr:PorV/PorQ family protein [Bacteroidota bacterium]